MTEAPSTRRKACQECVKAKRKCGMESPRCRRCQKKNITCAYPNTHTSISDLQIPELEFPWLDDLMREGTLPWSGGLQPQLAAASHLPSPFDPGSGSSGDSYVVPEYLASEGSSKNTMPRSAMNAAIHRFKAWPEKWLKEGGAPFIHPQLYVSSMPKPLQDAYAACAIHSTKTPENEFVALNIIEAKANELLRSPNQHSWTPLDLLAAVQGLMIFQFIRLFDGDIRQRALAESAEPILEAWTEQLKQRTIEERDFTTITAPSWRSWVFAESARRTIVMSLVLSGVYSLAKLGYCTMSERVTELSFTGQRALWEAPSQLAWERAKTGFSPHWVNKMYFEPLLVEANGAELEDFGMIMLIMYKGKDAIDTWLETTGGSRPFIAAPDLHESLMNMVQFQEGSISSAEPITS